MLSAVYVLLVLKYALANTQDNDAQEDLRPLCPCGNNNNSVEIRVVGGHDAGEGHFPYASCLFEAGMRSEPGLQMAPFCGATLISDSHVVTAAHCTRNRSPEDIVIDIGDYNFRQRHKERQLHQAVAIIRYPDYVPPKFHTDIAIIQFEDPVTWESNIRAAWLPPPDLQLAPGTVVSVYGWGRLTYDDYMHPKTLQSVDLPIVENSVCQKKFISHIESTMICAGGEKGHDACIGDSGSGLVVQLDNELVLCGLVSFGRKCALPKVAGVYTRVSKFVDWIYENTMSSQCKPCIYGYKTKNSTNMTVTTTK